MPNVCYAVRWSGVKLPAIQGNDMWVSQRVADGSGNVLDCDLGAEIRRAKIMGAPPSDPLTFGFDDFTKHRWETSPAVGPSETQCLEGWHHVLHNVIACVDTANDCTEQRSLNITSNHQTGTLLVLNLTLPSNFIQHCITVCICKQYDKETCSYSRVFNTF